MLLFVLFLKVLTTYTDGVWQLTYFGDKGCTGGHSATKLQSECVGVGDDWSFHFRCYQDENNNVTEASYHGNACTLSPFKEEHVAVNDECKSGDGVSTIWKCLDDFTPDYSYLDFTIALHMDQKDIGDINNPIIGQHLSPLVKCFKDPRLKHHISSECDFKTNIGTFKVYEAGACIFPIHTIEMKAGEVVDFSKLMTEKMYMKFNGCVEK